MSVNSSTRSLGGSRVMPSQYAPDPCQRGGTAHWSRCCGGGCLGGSRPDRPLLRCLRVSPMLSASLTATLPGSPTRRIIGSPHRLVAQDTALSRRQHGFESRWGHAHHPASRPGARSARPRGLARARSRGAAWSARHPVKVEVAGSNPVGTARRRRSGAGAWPGSSVGTSVRLKIGRSAVRPRPWPPQLCRSGTCGRDPLSWSSPLREPPPFSTHPRCQGTPGSTAGCPVT